MEAVRETGRITAWEGFSSPPMPRWSAFQHAQALAFACQPVSFLSSGLARLRTRLRLGGGRVFHARGEAARRLAEMLTSRLEQATC